MAEIPYFFETPIPKYFRENGWFECEHMFKFIHWAFSRCQTIPHKRVMEGKEILLQPYEFIAGRLSSPKQCFLTENIFRNQRLKLEKAGLLKKTTNSLTNHYSCYIWVTEAFSKNNNQQNNQPLTNRQPTINHKERRKKTRSKENHHPNPSSKVLPIRDDESDGLIDDSSSNNIENLCNITDIISNPPTYTPSQTTIEIIPGIFLTQNELDACIKLKGSLEKVKEAIEVIQTSKKRKYDITDWPNTLANWKIPNKAKVVIEDNISYADKLCKAFPEFINGNGWRCYIYTDKVKDQKGLLFEPQSSYLQAVFVSFSDGEFQKKCFEILKEKKMPISKPKAELSKA